MTKYWEGRTPPPEYFEQPNPYVEPPESHINLLALSRYAKTIGIAIADLPYDVVQQFAVTSTEQSTENKISVEEASRMKVFVGGTRTLKVLDETANEHKGEK